MAVTIPGTGLAGSLEDQRAAFLRAEQALRHGDLTEFRRLSDGLPDYPLYPYLQYQDLLGRLDKVEADEIDAFLRRYDETPLSQLLRGRWLDRLARERRWHEYLAYYRSANDAERRCHRLHALIATGRSAEAVPQVAEIWLHGRSRPAACDPVFQAWGEAGHRTDEITWQRIELAMEAGEWRLARYLGRSLPDAERAWVARWIDLYLKPTRALGQRDFREVHRYRERMLSHAVRRMARLDDLKALEIWQQIKTRYPFDADQIRATEHTLVRHLVREADDRAYAFIKTVDVGQHDVLVNEARIRAALLREDWTQVVRWIAQLPAQERDNERWIYWLARALEGRGDNQAATALYATAARERSYYGFLAADRIGHDYYLEHAETPVTDEAVQQIADIAAVQRARELFALQRWTDARREWQAATRDMDANRLKAAAKLAKRQGWHDRAIFTLARTGYWDDLELRFPLEHVELVEQNARRHEIDIAWVFAVMRQESAFMHNARSHAGAMGLMQLMPATARNVARKMLKRKAPRRHELLQPDTNIALGSAYLKQMKGRLGDSAVLATAAYNAGPHRVTDWLPDRTLPADIWIELVPFKETRGYLRRVLAYTVIYEKRMGKEPTRLLERLHPVPPSVSLIGSPKTAARLDSSG